MPKLCPRCFEFFATSSIESALSPSDAYLEIENSPPSRGTVAIPALSYPRFFKIVNPSSKNSRASLCSEVPITPTIPQQSVVTAESSNAANADVAATAATRAIAFFAFHKEEADSESRDAMVDTARVDASLEDDFERCLKRFVAFPLLPFLAFADVEALETRYLALCLIIVCRINLGN